MIAALLFLAQLAPAPDEPKPVVTTIAAIRANAKKFDGQLVRLHGWVNACQPLSCAVEERPARDVKGPGERLSIAADKKFDDTIRPLLPTYVEFDARVNAACLTTSVCTDRAAVLSIVTLRGVVSPEPPEIEN
jgi:hypothetical protein